MQGLSPVHLTVDWAAVINRVILQLLQSLPQLLPCLEIDGDVSVGVNITTLLEDVIITLLPLLFNS